MNLKSSNYRHLWSHPKTMKYTSSYIFLWYIQSVIQEEKTNFIHILHRNCKKKKNQNYLYCISKTRHCCATSAYVFLAPVASSPKWVLLRCHSTAKSSPEVEREREREGVRALEICRCRPPLTPHPPPLNCQCGTFLPRPSLSPLGGTFQATAIFWDKKKKNRTPSGGLFKRRWVAENDTASIRSRYSYLQLHKMANIWCRF